MNRPLNLWTGLYLAVLLGWKDCVNRFGHPIPATFVVVVPLAMVFFTGSAFKGFEPQAINVTVALVDEDHGKFSELFRDAFKEAADLPAEAGAAGKPPEKGAHVHFLPDPISRDEARHRLDERQIDGAVVLPAGLSEDLAKGDKGQIEVLVGPKATLARSIVEDAVAGVVGRVRGGRDPWPLDWRPVPYGTDTRLVEGFNSFTQAVSGNGVMFILFNCILIGGMAVVHERERNTLDRLLISPLSPRMIFLGKVLGVYAVGLVQAVVVFGFGAFFAPLGDPVGLVLTTLLFILVGCAMALTISSLARNEDQVQDIGAPIALLMAALGGGMFPLENAPYWMRVVSMFFPTGWAMDAYNKLMREGKNWQALWPDLLVLAAFATVFFVIGGRSLRR